MASSTGSTSTATARAPGSLSSNRQVIDAVPHARSTTVGVGPAADDRPADMVARLNALLARHPLSPSISGHDASDWHLHVAPGDGPLADDYAAGAAMGLTMAFLDLGPERFGSCAAPGCAGVFLDTSRNRSRRYCSDRCASRENVAALRSRRRAGE